MFTYFHHMLYSFSVSILTATLIAFPAFVTGQSRIGDWKIHSSTLSINDVCMFENLVFCATDGGLLVYDVQTQTFETVTKIDGMVGTAVAAVASDDDDFVWIGGNNPTGFIQTYDANNGRFEFEFDLGLNAVNDFIIKDSIAFAVFTLNQDFGLIELIRDGENVIYRDVYRNWPAGVTEINSISSIGNDLYLGTNRGVLTADYRTSNLKDSGQWSYYFGFPAGKNSITVSDHTTLYAIIGDSLHISDLSTKIQDSHGIASNFIARDIALGTDRKIWILSEDRLYHFDGTTVTFDLKIPGTNSSSLTADNNSIFIGTSHGLGIYTIGTQEFTLEAPNTITSGAVSALLLKSDGRIVAGSRRGISILESWGWRNIVSQINSDFRIHDSFDESRFAADTIPVHFGEYVSDIEEGPDGRIYCAIRGTYPEPRLPGGGIISIDIDNPEDVELIDTTYLDYFSSAYMVVKDLEFGRNDALWIADTYSTTRFHPVHVRYNDGSWEHFKTSQHDGLGLTPNTLSFDGWGRLWIGSFRDDFINGSFMNGGLTLMLLEGEPEDLEHTFVEIPTHSDNSMKTVWSIAISERNRLYALTPAGLILMDLEFSDQNPVGARNPFIYFSNIPFGEGSKVVLDPRENAWVLSSSDGIHVLRENTAYWPDDDPDVAIENISETNSPLLSDQVTGIDFDPEKGLALISSARGINVFKIPFARPVKTLDKVKIFPSPFLLPSGLPLVISGLMDNSSVKIMSITGEVFRTLKYGNLGSHGYQITWDGRNEEGQLVGTGVYLVAIYETGGKTTFEKIAVIRR